ncbi:MAG: hypothetical protein Q9227_002136 [Pyrenula ochraceoflavens]
MLGNVQWNRTRRPQPLHIVISAFVAFFFFFLWINRSHGQDPSHNLQVPAGDPAKIAPDSLKGEVVMPKLGNETAKEELGRAAWKLFHTTMARFPEEPTKEQSEALKSYIWLFARLGECAGHFQKILAKYPPQTTSRNTAAAWGCFVHNEVNKSKKKPLFDCTNIGDFYDCGCAEDENDVKKTNGKDDKKEKVLKESEPVEVHKEEKQHG